MLGEMGEDLVVSKIVVGVTFLEAVLVGTWIDKGFGTRGIVGGFLLFFVMVAGRMNALFNAQKSF